MRTFAGARLPPRHAALLPAGGAVVLLLAACAGRPDGVASNGRVWDAALGVWSSPRVVADGEAVPRGGGSSLTGRPYVIGGRTYVPSQNPAGYTAVGMASWYGDAFHGRRTANGEVFDKGSISAAHPTLPLPSYVRVTNTRNGRSIIVRVNDRGPYHGGRVMDVSQRVADALAFRGEGTARVKIDYVGRAALQGSDDGRLLATLRTDGAPAQLEGQPVAPPVLTARGDSGDAAPAAEPVAIAAPDAAPPEETPAPSVAPRRKFVPLPPTRPLTLGAAEPERSHLPTLFAAGHRPDAVFGGAPAPISLTLREGGPFRSSGQQGTLDANAESHAAL